MEGIAAIDSKDRKILSCLQENANISMEKLSEICFLSKNACWNRVKRMEKSGIIVGKTIIIDPNAINLNLKVFVSIKTNQHDASWVNEFAGAVKKMNEVTCAYRLSGDVDYLLILRIGSVDEYDHFYQKLVENVSMAYVSSNFVLGEIKETQFLPIL